MKLRLLTLILYGIIFAFIFIIFDSTSVESGFGEHISGYEHLIPVSMVDAGSLYKMISH